MEEIYKKARAKINLTLNVLDKREDGYHNIETIFQKISLYDEILVSKTKEDGIKIDVNISDLREEDNIIYKAYKILKSKFNKISGVHVVLKKNIPMQAGLAGGSTDCGAFIECMNKLFKLNLTKEEMIDIGKKLGADVPQSFYNIPVIARGIGEKIEEIASNAKYYVIVIKPDFSCNTKEMFEKLDKRSCKTQVYGISKMKEALINGDSKEVSKNLYNIFEIAVKDVENLKKELISAGALGSVMCGSGSAVCGIFENKEKAKKGYKDLSKKYKTYYCLTYVK